MTQFIALSTGTQAGQKIAVDRITVGATAVDFQLFKLVIGSTGSQALVHAGNALPVDVTGGPISVKATGTALAVKVSGSITIVEPITISGNVKVSGNVSYLDYDTATGASQTRLAFGIIVPGSGGGVAAGGTGRPIRISPSGTALPVKVSGTVAIAEPITISGSITNITNVVSVKATGTALAVKVSGSVTIVEPITISGSLTSITNPVTVTGDVEVTPTTVDDAAFTPGTTRIIGIAGFFDSATGTVDLVDNHDLGIVRMSSGRVLFIRATGTALVVKTSGNVSIAEPITISGNVSVLATDGATSVKVGDNTNKAVRVNVVAGAAGGVSHVDDAAFTPAVDDIIPMGAYFASVTGTPDQVNLGDSGVVRMTSGRILLVSLSTASGARKNNVVSVSGNVNLAEPVTISGNVAVTSLPSSTNTLEIVGDVAHDAAAAGNPVLIAGRAMPNEPTAVTSGDSSFVWVDLQGRPVVMLNHPASTLSTGLTGHGPRYFLLTATTIAVGITAPGAGQSIHITDMVASNTGVANSISIFTSGDTATGGKGFRVRLVSSGGGVVRSFNPPWKLTANKGLVGRLDSAGSVLINTHYYVAP